ncbi:hypothetical protein EDB80DRAFT_841532, partial [Ilyonectria destructans]
DFLSFISLVLHEYDSFDLGFTLLSALLAPDSFHSRSTAAEGRALGRNFQITMSESETLLESRQMRQEQLPAGISTMPQIVALKRPLPKDDDLNSVENRKMWTSIAKELRVLKNSFIAAHPNIVSLLGICWAPLQSDARSLMPVLVLEAAELGDLSEFCRDGRRLFPRKWIGLCIDVTSGLAALHKVGVFHGDLKPQNVLIFEDQYLTYTAKLADFDSSIFVEDLRGPAYGTSETPFWSAPERSEPLTGEQLMKADIYSLGLLLWDMLPGGYLQKTKSAVDSGEIPTGKTFEQMKASGELSEWMAYYFLYEYWEGVYGQSGERADDASNADTAPTIGMRVGHAVMKALEPPSTRTATVQDLLVELREILNDVLRYELFRSLPLFNRGPMTTDLNPQEADALYNPPCELFCFNSPVLVLSNASYLVASNPSLGPFNVQSRRVGYEGMLLYPFPVGGEFSMFVTQLDKVVPSELTRYQTQRLFGQLILLPIPVITQLLEQLKVTANNAALAASRRALSAYEYGILSLSLLQISTQEQPEVDQSLSMVAKAAELGHAGARGIVGWLYDALGRTMTALAPEQTHLRHPTVFGNSSTAHRRLRQLGMLHLVNRRGLGYAGIKHKAATGSQLPMETYIPKRTKTSQHVQRLLWGASCHGEYKALRLLTTNRLPEINITDSEGNTALLMASRHGHLQPVLHLLVQGADPTLANSQGITALHCLSAFRDEDIQTVAQALIDNNASLDARAASKGTLFLDPIYPTPEGTPLSWAVAANNMTAVATLVNLGADPFDEAGQTAQTSDRWTEFNRLSPVVLAVVRHQHEVLGALFPASRREAISDLGNRLINIRINVGSQGVVDTSLFALCARYDIEGLLPRLLLHGRKHKEAFKETFELLINLGANPTETAHRGAAIIGIAVHFGQPFVLEYLMEWDHGRLREWSRVWYEMIIRAAQDSNRAIFDILMKYEVMDQIDISDWGRFFVTMAKETNDIHFLDPFAHKAREAGDLGPHLSIAIDAGNFETARWINTVTSTCDVAQPVGVGDDALSLLGRIIMKSRTFDSLRSAIHAFLDLQNDPDQVFYNAMTLAESQLTALHPAALYLEYCLGVRWLKAFSKLSWTSSMSRAISTSRLHQASTVDTRRFTLPSSSAMLKQLSICCKRFRRMKGMTVWISTSSTAKARQRW